MTTTDPQTSIDDILSEPIQGRGWIVGLVTDVDRARRRCLVADHTGDTVTLCYRPEDESAVLHSFKHRDQCHLKALGLAEYQPGSVMTSMSDIERMYLITCEEAEHPTVHTLWDDLNALLTPSEWAGLPSDLAENHDDYLAREYHNDDAGFDG